MFDSIAALRDHLAAPGRSLEYVAKMLHEVPDLPVVADRARYLVEKVKGKAVLDIGCAGPLSPHLRAVATRYHGIDKQEGGDWLHLDVDAAPQDLPTLVVDLVIAGELLEHLANPGTFLAQLRAKYPATPVYFTVPHAGAYRVQNDCEIVNRDHVAWYSYTTLKTLLTRHGYVIHEARWYNGEPHKAEGLIVLAV